MSKSSEKITLAPVENIPFDRLRLTGSNVRKVTKGLNDEELTQDIGRRGLLQSLSVRPVLDEAGAETGYFTVPAGGRRFRALERLVAMKRLSKSAPVPCIIKRTGSPEEDSLVENTQRASLHPLDQFRAFQTLIDQGLSEDDIAARFFVSKTQVKQRLKLASVSPKLLDLYAEDGLRLEQIMAFSVSTDHVRQEQVWNAIQGVDWQQEPYHIKRALTETTVPAKNKRALFIGAEAYLEAGGVIARDLFDDDKGGFYQDSVLLDRLVAGKLNAVAKDITTEGWKWIEVRVDLPYGHAQGLREILGVSAELSDEDKAIWEALSAEYTTLSDTYSGFDELPEEIDARFGELEKAMEPFDNRPVVYDPAEIAIAGVFISVAGDGSLNIDRGYVRPEDETPIVSGSLETDAHGGHDPEADSDASLQAAQPKVIRVDGQTEADGEGEEDDEVLKPLPDRLISELSAYRTVALRDALANNPQVAVTALLHKLCADMFLRDGNGCLEARISPPSLTMQGPDLKDSPSAQSVGQRHQAWQAMMPKDEDSLWTWLAGLDEGLRQSLLAHCISAGVNALYQKADKYGGGVSEYTVRCRLAQADRLAMALDLDVAAAGWVPTVHNYLNRVPKPRILEAVREARGEQFAGMIDHLKRGDMATEAERLLEGTGWLPEPLRSADFDVSQTDVSSEDQTEADNALPAFLVDDEAEDDDAPTGDGDDDESSSVAAE